jgi:nicotinate-nucleotide pyrophosphorylase
VKLGLSPEGGKKHRLRLYENRMLKRIFVSMAKDVTRGWEKLHN